MYIRIRILNFKDEFNNLKGLPHNLLFICIKTILNLFRASENFKMLLK